MRFLGISLVIAVALALTACSSKSSNNSSSSDQSSMSSSSASPAESGASPAASEAATSPADQIPMYPGATTQSSGTSSNMGQSAEGTVMMTDDSFDKVYAWYQSHMPAGSEKTHVTAPVQNAVFTAGNSPQDQTSVSITATGGKTMITIGRVKQP